MIEPYEDGILNGSLILVQLITRQAAILKPRIIPAECQVLPGASCKMGARLRVALLRRGAGGFHGWGYRIPISRYKAASTLLSCLLKQLSRLLLLDCRSGIAGPALEAGNVLPLRIE